MQRSGIFGWRQVNGHRGQSLLEYAVLIAAVVLGVSTAGHFLYERFVEHASRVERNHMIF